MVIPTEAIHSLHSISKNVAQTLPANMSLHGSLAADLALHHNGSVKWTKSVPEWSDFEATLPYLWPEQLQRLLPVEAKDILTKQYTMFERDWGMFKNAFVEISKQDYLYAWLIVNTRSFYYETSDTLRLPWHDRLSLLPAADLFNHADTGCSVSYSMESYTITTDRHYQKGDELYTSYGNHSNDFLLAEYGFLLKENRWDKLCLNDVILPKLNSRHKAELTENGHTGTLMLHDDSRKHDDIWVALRLLSSVDSQWQSYIDGEEDTEGTLAKAIASLPPLLGEYLDAIQGIKLEIQSLQVGTRRQKTLLTQRWDEIEAMVRRAIETAWFAM
ncbi:hypothetical protein VHEMI04429 [[Torrubiella] hemipterigena]|nr:hypothetical protein VHEMI04429 [[Torrubiella] hemipterigena]